MFDVFAKDAGQVFGGSLDDQPAPKIYLAATSAHGLNLIGRTAPTANPSAGTSAGPRSLLGRSVPVITVAGRAR